MVLVVRDPFDWDEYSRVLSSSERVRSWQSMVDQHLVPVDRAIGGTRWSSADLLCHVDCVA
jgi:hypothetical protein